MEKRLTLKINEHLDVFKCNILNWANNNLDGNSKKELLELIYDHNKLELVKEDFTKRKRVKSITEQYLRCNACRANGEQCTRKKKDKGLFCGTHDKNRPHGIYENNDNQSPQMRKVNISLKEIKGIFYYIDEDENVYKSEDIISNKINPSIIAKYKKDKDEYILIQ